MAMSNIDVKITENHDKVVKAMQQQLRAALEDAGQQAVAHAKSTVPVDTGNLKNSINYSVSDDKLKVGTDVEYGKYVELGSVHSHTASHFLLNAMQNHTSEYKQTIENQQKR